jgi:hypothetical protein
MGSGTMTYAPRFINIGSGIRKLIAGYWTHRQHGGHISLLLFIQTKERRLTTIGERNFKEVDLGNQQLWGMRTANYC